MYVYTGIAALFGFFFFFSMFDVVGGISGCMFAVRSINDQCGCLPALPGKRCPISAALCWCSHCWDRENKERFVPAAYYPPRDHEPTTDQEPTHQKKKINQKIKPIKVLTNLFQLGLILINYRKYWGRYFYF